MNTTAHEMPPNNCSDVEQTLVSGVGISLYLCPSYALRYSCQLTTAFQYETLNVGLSSGRVFRWS
jgi:hypothetical protein